jgi:chromosome partitioning protein
MSALREDSRFSPFGEKKRRAKMLAFVNQKGGTGKTTIAQNLAVCFALYHSQRVLCVDLDPQGNFGEGLIATSINTAKTADRLLLVPSANISEYIMRARPRVDLIPNRFQRELRESVDRLPLCANLLRKQLSQVLVQYDYILIDTPAGLCRSTQIGVDAADQVVIVISCGKYALSGTAAMIDWISGISDQLGKQRPAIKVVLNNFDERRLFDREFKREVRYIFGNDLYQTQIRSSIRIVEASAQAMAVVELPQANNGAADFKRLAREILGLPANVGTLAQGAAEAEPQEKGTVLKLVS